MNDDRSNADFTVIRRRRIGASGAPLPDDPRAERDEGSGSGSWMSRLRSSGALAWASKKSRSF